MIAIQTSSLSKIYSSGKKKINALNELSLNVPAGTIFGLLGPNGAGKTTLIKILLGITYPTFGSAKILDTDISDYSIKQKVGYLPENHKYQPYLNAVEVLSFFGKLSGVDGIKLTKKIDELLETVKLTERKKSKVKTYSKGMMQRLGLAQALINDPELIFLDEPTDGVDPIGRKEIRDVLVDLRNQSKTIFLNSHLLSEVEMITDRVGILNKGKLLREGSVKELTEKKEEYKIRLNNDSADLTKFASSESNIYKNSDGTFTIKVDNVASLNKLIDKIRNESILVQEIILQKSTLEEMFISVINEAEGADKK